MIGIDLRANFYKICTYALLALAIAGAATTVYWRTKAKVAGSNLAVAEEQRDKARYIAEQVINFNAGFQQTTDVLRIQLRACQAGVRKAKDENEQAQAKLIAEKRDIEGAFKKFVGQFDNKGPTCEAALKSLDVSCKSLAGY